MGEPVEYFVITECGRHFIWSAPDLDWLFRRMTERNYRVTFVMSYEEYLQLDPERIKELEMKKAA